MQSPQLVIHFDLVSLVDDIINPVQEAADAGVDSIVLCAPSTPTGDTMLTVDVTVVGFTHQRAS